MGVDPTYYSNSVLVLNPHTYGLPDTVRERIRSHSSLAERIPNVKYTHSRARQSPSPELFITFDKHDVIATIDFVF